MEKTLIVDPERCSGCGICELVCSFKKWGIYNPKKAFIRIVTNKDLGFSIPMILPNCDLCNGEELCVHSCPKNVLQFLDLNQAALLRKKQVLGRFPAPVIRGLK